MENQAAQPQSIDFLRERRFTFDGRTYTIRFTQNALARLQEQIKEPLADYFNRVFDANKLRVGHVELQHLLWAGMEGSRLKDRVRRGGRAWDFFEVGDLMEEVWDKNEGDVFDLDRNEMYSLAAMISEAFVAGFQMLIPKSAQAEEASSDEATPEQLEEQRKNDPTNPATGAGS